MLVKVYGASMQGLQATAVTIEVNATRGVRFVLVGLPDNAVKESHERILAAIENSGYTFPTRQITINLSPADIRKEGSGYDLPMAIGILATEDKVNTTQLANYMMVGELSLDGSLVPIRGALPVAIKAREMGFEGLFVPEGNIREAAVVNKLKVYGVRHIPRLSIISMERNSWSQPSLTHVGNSMLANMSSTMTLPMSRDRSMSREPWRWQQQEDII